MRAAEIMKKAHEIRNAAAHKFGGKAGDYSMKIALEMAWKGEEVATDELEAIVEIINKDSDWNAKIWEKGQIRRIYINHHRGSTAGYIENSDGLEFHKGSGKGQIRFADFWKELRAAGFQVAA